MRISVVPALAALAALSVTVADVAAAPVTLEFEATVSNVTTSARMRTSSYGSCRYYSCSLAPGEASNPFFLRTGDPLSVSITYDGGVDFDTLYSYDDYFSGGSTYSGYSDRGSQLIGADLTANGTTIAPDLLSTNTWGQSSSLSQRSDGYSDSFSGRAAFRFGENDQNIGSIYFSFSEQYPYGSRAGGTAFTETPDADSPLLDLTPRLTMSMLFAGASYPYVQYNYTLTPDRFNVISDTPAPVPLPPTLAMLLAGFGALVMIRRRKQTA